MNFFKVIYAMFYGIFFCLLSLMLFVFYTCGILPVIFLGVCALLVLFMLGFCSWQYDYTCKIKEEMNEIYDKIAKLENRFQKQEEESENIKNNIIKLISYCQERNEMYNYIKKNKTQVGNIQKDNSQINQIPIEDISNMKTYSVKAELKGNNPMKQSVVNINRDGAGAFRLTGQELIPAKLQEGNILDKNQFDEMQAYEMSALFEVNSKEVIGHKIVKIEPAFIDDKYDLEKEYSFEGNLLKKGKIEVENPVNDYT